MSLIGFPSPKPAVPQDPNAPVFDVTTADFESRVLKASMDKPVLVDFWAPWCGPCKQLMPILEAEVNAAQGAVLLAKVNIDECPELAQALRIQSVPTVMAFFGGQPVTGFTGARPASDIKNLIAQLVKIAKSAMPDALDIPASLQAASDSLIAGDARGAQDIYLQILAQDETNAEAYAGLIRCLMAVDALDQAQGMVDNAPQMIAKSPALMSVRTALELAQKAGEAMKALKPMMDAVARDENNHQARFDLAGAQFAAGDKAGAIENLLTLIAKDRGWNNDAARLELLRYFEALGFNDPLSVEGRKKLSRLLFS